MALSPAEKQKRYRARNAVTPGNGNAVTVTRGNARCRVCPAKDRELEMLRLDVERLKGELSVARLATREAGSGERVMTTLWSSDEVWGRVMPKDATCGGPGKCGRIGCGHPGWGR